MLSFGSLTTTKKKFFDIILYYIFIQIFQNNCFSLFYPVPASVSTLAEASILCRPSTSALADASTAGTSSTEETAA